MVQNNGLESFLDVGAAFLYSVDAKDIAIICNNGVLFDRIAKVLAVGFEFEASLGVLFVKGGLEKKQ